MPHLLPSFVETVIQHYKLILKLNSHFADKATGQAINQRLFKMLEDKESDVLNKSLQRHIRLEVVDEVVEIVGQCPNFASKYLT